MRADDLDVLRPPTRFCAIAARPRAHSLNRRAGAQSWHFVHRRRHRARRPQAHPHAVGSSHGSDVPLRNRDGSERLATEQVLLPTDRARFAGEGITGGARNLRRRRRELVDTCNRCRR